MAVGADNRLGGDVRIKAMKLMTFLLLSAGAGGAWAAEKPAPGAQGGWMNIAQGNEKQCGFAFLPTQDDPVLITLGSEQPDTVLLMMISDKFPQLRTDARYVADVEVDGGAIRSPAVVQKMEGAMMVGTMLPISRLDDFARTEQVRVLLDGRNLVRFVTPGRRQAAADLRTCMKRLPAVAAAGKAAPSPGGMTGHGASSTAQPASGSGSSSGDIDALLRGAEAKGQAVAGRQPQGQRPSAGGAARGAAAAAAQAVDTQTLLMMMRLNNHMAMGGTLAGDTVGVMQGFTAPGGF